MIQSLIKFTRNSNGWYKLAQMKSKKGFASPSIPAFITKVTISRRTWLYTAEARETCYSPCLKRSVHVHLMTSFDAHGRGDFLNFFLFPTSLQLQCFLRRGEREKRNRQENPTKGSTPLCWACIFLYTPSSFWINCEEVDELTKQGHWPRV